MNRIQDVKALRMRQFVEDAGPLAHPVQPQSYITIDNFYTATVYEKGSEVIRMLKTLVGDEGYRKATDLYFERHDGQAATVEDWVKCFEDACGRDLKQFRLWYAQSGTPGIEARGEYDRGEEDLCADAEAVAWSDTRTADQETDAYPRAARLCRYAGRYAADARRRERERPERARA